MNLVFALVRNTKKLSFVHQPLNNAARDTKKTPAFGRINMSCKTAQFVSTIKCRDLQHGLSFVSQNLCGGEFYEIVLVMKENDENATLCPKVTDECCRCDECCDSDESCDCDFVLCFFPQLQLIAVTRLMKTFSNSSLKTWSD